MLLTEFDYHLPKELIAQKPMESRSSSRLFFYDRKTGERRHLHFSDITEIFGQNDVLVLNKSRVIPARIRMDSKEIFLLEKISSSGTTHLWKCLARKGSFFREGRTFSFPDGTTGVIQKCEEGGVREVEFSSPDFQGFICRYGEMPLPPYIHEKIDDPERYQTVYAKEEGSVAAPTAGFHFTPEIMKELKGKGVVMGFVTLHVGLGTFQPVKTDLVEDHEMHEEWFSLNKETADSLNTAKEKGKEITAVGSTSLRTLESSIEKKNVLRASSGKTDLFLYPPAEFHFADHLITNFHLPKSTLIMLIASFLSPGKTDGIRIVRDLYEEAIGEKYRFFSFGDAMLIW